MAEEKVREEVITETDPIEPMGDTWGVGAVWNAALLVRDERERKPRDYVYASELGKPLVDIWLNLRATPYTNPPNARSMRKFMAGDIWEWIVRLLLLKCGILVESQEIVEHQYEGLIKVRGRLDFVAGGKPDFEKGRAELESLALMSSDSKFGKFLHRAGVNIIDYLQEKYPNGLENKVVEVKSCSAFMFENHLRGKTGSKNHRMQNTHYLVGKNERCGELFYVCRDDCRILEIPILNPSPDVDIYKTELQRITEAMKSDERPALEPEIIFDEESGKFSKNWGIEYSQYLTMLYGYERPDQYVDKVKPLVAKFNRVMGRVKRNEKMTAKNLEALEEMKGFGFNPQALVDKFAGVDDDEETSS